MINIVWQSVLSFFSLALIAVTIQNTVLARALGVSRLISLVDDTTDTLIFGLLMMLVTVIAGVLNYFVYSLFIVNSAWISYIRPLSIVVCMVLSYMLVYVLAVKFAPYAHIEKAVGELAPATFNCTVLGTLILTTSRQLPLLGTIGFAIGTSIGYVLAVFLVTEGQRKLQNDDMPAAFKGLPATLLYLAGLAFAVYGLTGYSFSF
ncbi:MAG: Rnf-Nqr domain containing protein [Oscillospiraceae bacterium]|nr:Rnf-Nqr domain containing protein [Oscillospiraceae bacterium]